MRAHDVVSRVKFWTVVVLGGLALGGCSGDGLPRQPIQGSVKLDGKPIEKGTIQFIPAENTPEGHAIASGGPILRGSYSIPRSQGLVPGKYKVMISAVGASAEEVKARKKAFAGEEEGAMPGLGPVHPEELIPEDYNSKTALLVTVTKEGPNDFDFDLKKE